MIALDSNVLVYAESPDDPNGRYEKSIRLIGAVSTIENCLPLQVIGEFLNVCRRKRKMEMGDALRRAQAYANLFDIAATTFIDIEQAALWSDVFNLQFFDALIIAVARRAGATILLTEDMHDGLVVDGLTILNPFNAANATVLASYLDGSG